MFPEAGDHSIMSLVCPKLIVILIVFSFFFYSAISQSYADGFNLAFCLGIVTKKLKGKMLISSSWRTFDEFSSAMNRRSIRDVLFLRIIFLNCRLECLHH